MIHIPLPPPGCPRLNAQQTLDAFRHALCLELWDALSPADRYQVAYCPKSEQRAAFDASLGMGLLSFALRLQQSKHN